MFQSRALTDGEEFFIRHLGAPCDLRRHVNYRTVLEMSRREVAESLCRLQKTWLSDEYSFVELSEEEGWGLSGILACSEADPELWLRCGLEALPDSPEFREIRDDRGSVPAEVLVDAHVIRCAHEGRPVHRLALRIHLMCNALRFMCWGRDYVHEREEPR